VRQERRQRIPKQRSDQDEPGNKEPGPHDSHFSFGDAREHGEHSDVRNNLTAEARRPDP
jgi:hypothetical protein